MNYGTIMGNRIVQTNKSIPRLYDSCMTFLLHFMPFMMELLVQHMGDTFPTLMDLDYLTKHITLKLFPFLQKERIYINYYGYIYQSTLTENKGVRLTIDISGLHTNFIVILATHESCASGIHMLQQKNFLLNLPQGCKE